MRLLGLTLYKYYSKFDGSGITSEEETPDAFARAFVALFVVCPNYFARVFCLFCSPAKVALSKRLSKQSQDSEFGQLLCIPGVSMTLKTNEMG